MNRSLSDRKLKANRENARKSTGPRTVRGKQISARNSIRHGILAREAIVTHGDGREDVRQFHRLTDRLYDDYQPIGEIEERLVETIAVCLLRKARVLRAETGELRKGADCARINKKFNELNAINLEICRIEVQAAARNHLILTDAERKMSTLQKVKKSHDDLARLRNSSRGLDYIIGVLYSAREELVQDRCIEEYLFNVLVEIFSLNSELWQYLSSACKFENPLVNAGNLSDVEKVKQIDDCIEYLDNELKRLNALKACTLLREKLEEDAEIRSLSLPPKDKLDNILRYETHIDRQMSRAMDQLERLQRRRRGEMVPPPLSLNVQTKD